MKKLLFISLVSILSIISFSSNVYGEEVVSPVGVYLMQDVKSAIRQAQARYDSGNVTGAADLARKILAKYPDNADAKAILDKCIATEREDYENAVNSLTVSQLTAFQNKYPYSKYGEDVTNRIADLPLWLAAKGTNTINAYNKYLAESTHKIYKDDADNAISEITVKQAFDVAVAANTIKAFEQFRDQYPNSKYDKDASNKIARLMADKFTAKSTYTDKNNALAYAQNEMTRDYVNNKFNKAIAKKDVASSSSMRSGSSYNRGSSTNHSSATSSGISRNKVSDPVVMFGIDSSLEWFPRNTVLGIGPILRIGRYRSPFFATIAARYSYASFKSTYTDYHYDSGYNDITIQGKGSYINFPVTINWNMTATLGAGPGVYLGLGYAYNVLIKSNAGSINKNPTSWIIQMGVCGRHFDFKFGASVYSTRFAKSNRVNDNILIDLGFSYYF